MDIHCKPRSDCCFRISLIQVHTIAILSADCCTIGITGLIVGQKPAVPVGVIEGVKIIFSLSPLS